MIFLVFTSNLKLESTFEDETFMLIFQGCYCGKMIIDQIKDIDLLFIKISMQVNNCGKGSQSKIILG